MSRLFFRFLFHDTATIKKERGGKKKKREKGKYGTHR